MSDLGLDASQETRITVMQLKIERLEEKQDELRERLKVVEKWVSELLQYSQLLLLLLVLRPIYRKPIFNKYLIAQKFYGKEHGSLGK